ncbi:DUF3023 domain-containing protein [Ehrlichia sp. JZT12]
MLGSNKDGIINIDLSVINSIQVNRIVCIGSTAANGRLRIYFSKSCAYRKTSCNSEKDSLYLLVCKLLPQEVKGSLLAEDELLQNNSKAYSMSGTVNMYILVKEENINPFLKEVYYKILSKKQLIFDNLNTYGICVLARVINNKSHDSFDEFKALQSVEMLANAEYRSYDLEEKNIIKEKSLQNYEIFSRTLNHIGGITINKVTCIGNTEFPDNYLRVYTNNKKRKDKVLPCETSLFMFTCKVPSHIVKADTILTGILTVLKSSIIPKRGDSLFFTVFLLVFKDKLTTFLDEVYYNEKSYNVTNLNEYGKVVLAYPAYPLEANISSKKNCFPWEIKILKELGILESAMESRLMILGDDTPRTQLPSSESEVRNYSTFSSFQEEEEITHSGNISAFSTFRERVRTLFSNVRSNRIEYRNVNHQ